MLLQASDIAGSHLEERFKIASAVDYSEDEYILVFDAIDNHIFAHGKAARSRAEIPITGASCMRKVGQKTKSIGDGVNQSSGDVHTATFPCDIEPDVIKVGFGPWRNEVCH